MKNVGAFEVTTPTDHEILVTRIFDAPRAAVFEAWTNAEHVRHWWDPSGVPLSACEIDLRPNGTFQWVNSAHGGEHSFSGTYREITAPERLVFTVKMFPSRPDPLATLLFSEYGRKTKLTMRIECNSIDDRDALLQMRIDVGTGRTLENLAEYLDRVDLEDLMQTITATETKESAPPQSPATSARVGTVLSKDGTPIAFDRIGSGSPVILVDGALCYRGMGQSGQLAELLAPFFTVFTYDRRGRGGSGDTAPYAVEREVEDIAALLSEAGGVAFLWGMSSGAVLALEAANRLSGIKKVALYEAPFIVDDSRSTAERDWVRIAEAVAANRCKEAVKLFLKSVGVPAVFTAVMPLMPMWSKLKAVAHTLPYDGAIVGDNQRGQPLPAERWTSVTVPALVMDGGKSPTWMHRGNRSLASVLPNARYQTIDGQTHMLKPKAHAPILVEFFNA